MLTLAVILITGAFLVGHVEVDDGFSDNVNKLTEEGQSWEYIGRTEWDSSKGPAMSLKTDDNTQNVWFKMSNPLVPAYK